MVKFNEQFYEDTPADVIRQHARYCADQVRHLWQSHPGVSFNEAMAQPRVFATDAALAAHYAESERPELACENAVRAMAFHARATADKWTRGPDWQPPYDKTKAEALAEFTAKLQELT